jgi:hypothetical protein
MHARQGLLRTVDPVNPLRLKTLITVLLHADPSYALLIDLLDISCPCLLGPIAESTAVQTAHPRRTIP